jgi:hypothetical protein
LSTPVADDFKSIGLLYDDLRRIQLCAVATMGQERPSDLAALQAACIACNDPPRPCVACAKRCEPADVPANCRICFWQTGLPCPPR